jgi:hypothetical protein
MSCSLNLWAGSLKKLSATSKDEGSTKTQGASEGFFFCVNFNPVFSDVKGKSDISAIPHVELPFSSGLLRMWGRCRMHSGTGVPKYEKGKKYEKTGQSG